METTWKLTFRFLLGKLSEFKITTKSAAMAQRAPHAGSFHLSQTLFFSVCTYAQVSLSVIPFLLFFLCFPPLNLPLFPCFVETWFHVDQASHELTM